MPRYKMIFEADTIEGMKNLLKNASAFNLSGMDYTTVTISAGDNKTPSGPPQEERGSWVAFDG